MPYDPKDHCIFLTDGSFENDPDGKPSDIDHIFEQLAASGKNRLVIHFHGGLVDRKNGLAAANYLSTHALPGPNPPAYDGAFPIYFIWESGAIHEITSVLLDVAKEEIYKLLLERVTQFSLGKLGQAPGSRGTLVPESKFVVKPELLKQEGVPFEDVDTDAMPEDETLRPGEEQQFITYLQSDPQYQKLVAQIAASLQPQEEGARGPAPTPALTRMLPDVFEGMDVPPEGAMQARGSLAIGAALKIALRAATVLARVIVRFAKKRAHGVQGTIVEEILRAFYIGPLGEKVWGKMKDDTAAAFGTGPNFGGSLFLAKLRDYWAANPNLKVTLVGHSAGAVYVCNFLTASEPLMPDRNYDVAFLAPACDFEIFHECLDQHSDRINTFRMFSMDDQREQAEWLLEDFAIARRLYPGSLLYFISGVLESESDHPIVGMQRYYSGVKPYDAVAFPNIAAVAKYMALTAGDQVWSPSAADAAAGFRTNSSRHGDFDNDDLTLESLAEMLSK